MSEINKLYTIEFLDEEPFCRLDGVLLTDEYLELLCGCDCEMDFYSENIILIGKFLYTDSKNIGEILSALGEYHEPIEEYDIISSQGLGMEQHSYREKLNDCLVIHKFSDVRNIELKTMQEFYKNYPNFNYLEYKKIMDSLDSYYKNF